MDENLPAPMQAQIKALRGLVVDDDLYMRKVVRTMLSAIGVRTVDEARDGAEALEGIRSVNPDIIIVDWEMPVLDGPQLVRLVRLPGKLSDVPIIMLTGHADRVAEAAKIGIQEFLVKPVSTKALQDRIVSILAKSHAAVQGAKLAS